MFQFSSDEYRGGSYEYCNCVLLTHHENTKKIVDFIAKEGSVTLINAIQIEKVDLTEYELIGFASGIYYSKFHESVLKVAMEYLPQNKRVFLIYTYGFKRTGYGEDIAKIICEKRGQIVASYGCRGFDTFGPFKIVGGIAKGHPTDEEISEAVRVIKEFM